MNSVDDLMQKTIDSAQLISLPEIYLQLKALLDDPDYTMVEVSLLVGRDPGLAARFLQLVNSPLHRRVAPVETIGHAVSMLGSQQVHDTVLSASVSKAFEGVETDIIDMSKFWKQSMYCATIIRQLALEHENADTDRLFTIGLLADIGHLCMYMGIPEKAEEAIVVSREKKHPLYLAEQEILGFDYTQIGSTMMKSWSLPTSIHQPIAFQMTPGKADDFLLESAMLHIAAMLVKSDLENGTFHEGAFRIDPVVWKTTGFTIDQCIQARQTAAQQYDEVCKNVF